MLRREEGAAILIRDDRDWIGADSLRLRRDLVLAHSDERAQNLEARRVGDRRHVLERLRRDLADHFARHERLRVRLARELLGDSQHQSPVDDDAELGGGREHDLLLQLAERDEERSEEHTSELQSPDHLVCRLLLEKNIKSGLTSYVLFAVSI